MHIALRRACFALAALGLLTLSAAAQAPLTETQKQLARIDFAVSGKGEFNADTNGSNYLKQSVNLVPSNTFGYLIQLRYIGKPYFGLEFNYGYARYTQNFTITPSNTVPIGIQNNAKEYTFGYVVHTPKLYYGLQPFASVGAGTIAFKPTPGGGLGFAEQARAAYYYNIGVDAAYNAHLGFRAAFRQSFYLAPDFETNYLTDLKHTTSTEPVIGVYLRF